MGRWSVLATSAVLAQCLGCGPPRVLVVGLDGANWGVMDPLIEAGLLPTIGPLIRDGASFELDCVPASPPTACFCPPVWTSIATGRPASDHLVLGFETPSHARPVKALWNLVADYGGRSALFAFRGTWPPEPDVEVVLTEPGAGFAGEVLFDVSPPFAHVGLDQPETLFQPVDLLEQLGVLPSPLPPEERLPAWAPFAMDRVSMAALLSLAERRRDEAPWERVTDLTMILLHSIDKSEHVTWGTIQQEQYGRLDLLELFVRAVMWQGPVFAPPPFNWSDVPDQYLEADRWLGELLEIVDYDYVVFVSDHGMTATIYNGGLSGRHNIDHPEAHTGILAISGPGVRAGMRGQATVLDVAPTVAHLLGLPVALDLPGRALEEAFTDENLATFPVEWVDSWE